MKPSASLTEIDRRLIAQIERLYGPSISAPPEVAVEDGAVAHAGAPTGMALRTVALVALSAALLLWTEPGRAIYDAVSGSVQAGYEALSGALPR